MGSATESIEFPDNFVKVFLLSFLKVSETYREFPLLLLQENKGSKERWNDIVFAFTKQFHHNLILISKLLFIGILRVTLLIIIIPKRLSPLDFLN